MEELDPKSYRLLKNLNHLKNPKILIQGREFACLNHSGYIQRITPLGETPSTWKINDKGIEYILKRHSEKMNKIVPLIISYVLSAIAIIVSIIALMKK